MKDSTTTLSVHRALITSIALLITALAAAGARAAPQFVDLTPHLNQDGNGLSKNYTNLPRNTVLNSATLGTPFIITPDIDNDIFIAINNGTVSIDVNALATTVSFIGQIHYGIPNNQIVGNYTINYANASSVVIDLDNNVSSPGWNIDDHCCNWRQESLPGAPLAWKDPSTGFKETLLRELAWTNPFPGIEITTIDFNANGTSVSPVLAAITYTPVPVPPALMLLFGPAAIALARRRRD